MSRPLKALGLTRGLGWDLFDAALLVGGGALLEVVLEALLETLLGVFSAARLCVEGLAARLGAGVFTGAFFVFFTLLALATLGTWAAAGFALR